MVTVGRVAVAVLPEKRELLECCHCCFEGLKKAEACADVNCW